MGKIIIKKENIEKYEKVITGVGAYEQLLVPHFENVYLCTVIAHTENYFICTTEVVEVAED